MARWVKGLVYRLGKGLGLFHLAQCVTARKLRIICYHGVSINDEHVYSPHLFMQPETVRSRMEFLRRAGYAVLPLAEAVDRLYAGSLPPHAVVITYDDGFYGSFLHAMGLVRDFGLPMTFYVTTYYVTKQTPVFRLLVQYLFWKTDRRELNVEGLPGMDGETVLIQGTDRGEELKWGLIRHAEEQLDEPGRVALSRELGARLGVDYETLCQDRRLSLMNVEEVARMKAAGVDIQLHTHRHRMPSDAAQMSQEIRDNRAVLEPVVGHPCDHLCYPSGAFTAEQWPALEADRIASATTCIIGLNDARTPRYALRRFLDAENVTPIEFEAELSGFAELLRRARATFREEPPPTSSPMAYGH